MGLEKFYFVFIFIIGLYAGSLFTKIGNRLPLGKNIITDVSRCPKCDHELGIKDTIPVVSYFLNRGKCRYCNGNISIFYPFYEILTAILFIVCYTSFKGVFPEFASILFAILFVSALIVIMICDNIYMIIPDEILVFFTGVLLPIRIFILYKVNVGFTAGEMGYEVLFMLRDAFIIFSIMYTVRFIGNKLFKGDAMGGGDVKMMAFISMFIGWKLSIVVIFLGSFIALPVSMVKMYLRREHTLAFGPYLAIATLILFLLKIDYESILNFLI